MQSDLAIPGVMGFHFDLLSCHLLSPVGYISTCGLIPCWFRQIQ